MILGIILSTKRTESSIVVFQATFIKHLCLLGQCPREAYDEQLPNRVPALQGAAVKWRESDTNPESHGDAVFTCNGAH